MQLILHCFNMMTIGSYFAFIIFVMGTILVAQDISEEDEKQFIEDILDAHNHFRYKHASGPLELDDDLCEMTKIRVNGMKSGSLIPLPIKEYDVNCFQTDFDGTSDLKPFQIVEKWYNYKRLYNYYTEPRFSQVVHIDMNIYNFINVVWKSTKKIGVGILISDKKCYVAVVYSTNRYRNGLYSSNIIHPNVAAVLNQQETDRLLGDLVKYSG